MIDSKGGIGGSSRLAGYIIRRASELLRFSCVFYNMVKVTTDRYYPTHSRGNLNTGILAQDLSAAKAC